MVDDYYLLDKKTTTDFYLYILNIYIRKMNYFSLSQAASLKYEIPCDLRLPRGAHQTYVSS